MRKILLAAAAGSMLLHTAAMAAPSDANNVPPPGAAPMAADPGRQINTFQDYIERERTEQEIFRQRESSQAQVEEEQKAGKDEAESEIAFQLNQVQVDESRVLSQDAIRQAVAKYVGQSVSISQLYDMVEDINKLYEEQGYITCRAYLKPQKIEDGIVSISLLESSIGQAVISGNDSTDAQYILDRVPLKEGEISSINKLNKDILRFNGTNDAQLRIVLKAGEKEGTTDYYIQVKEPKTTSWTVFTDNMGNESTGKYRMGLFYNDRSLSGRRDALSLGTVFSQGTKAFTAMYNYPLGHSGTKLNLSYSTNRVEQVKDTDNSKFTGQGQSYSIGISQPWIVTDKYRSEITLDYNHQTSKSDFELVRQGFKFNYIDDTISNWTLGLAMTNYGSDNVLYQKHSLTKGQSNNVRRYFGDDNVDDFAFYRLSAFYQKAYSNGNQLSIRADGQYSLSGKLVSSSRQYYIGGMYSVRGYSESFMGGDGGINLSVEYAIPLSKDPRIQGFWFFDYGRVIGESAESNGRDRDLYGTGIGFKATLDKNINGVLTFGIPLKRSFEAKTDKVSPLCINFMLSAQF